jgi:YbbR domain-containing protein
MFSRENVLMVVASVLIALGVRIAIAPSLLAKESLFYAKIEYRGLPEDLTVVDDPQTWQIRATGAAHDIDQVDTDSVVAVVDLSMAKSGRRNYFVGVSPESKSRVNFAPRVPKIPLDIQKVSHSIQPVKVEASGQTPRDFVYDGAAVLPEKVKIIGAETVLPHVKVARVNLDLDQVRPGMSSTLRVEVLDDLNRPMRDVRCEPTEVTVSPAVVAAATKKRLLISPDWSGEPAYGYKVVSYEMHPSQIEVRGESADISSLATVETFPVNIQGIKSDTTVKTRVHLPAGIVSTEPDAVTVIVRVAKRPKSEMPGP